MLETVNLCKIYKPKKGVPVKALNNISLTFPEKGMVFLLGKSGSGKSTLLNLLGGLDKYDDGEIIIKGVSSKAFSQQHFDSYRNTYVGFIFQEYNVLDEFSVGANIALAIELQGRKASDEEINSILCEVDLEGYGNRKPNELSGGQKQRVAIARALVKNPEIIMADEPTGALDSNTGKQIFDTLKKLSKDKLVIIVSHDRDFSEQYADRIIELADGNIISDMEYTGEVEKPDDNITFEGNHIMLAEGYHLTEEDRAEINKYIDSIESGKVNLEVSTHKKSNKSFVNTDQSRIKKQDGKNFNIIKSRLPFKSAFKIGASSLKFKKVRLVVTILLSCIAFGLFGLADTFGSYNHIQACTDSLYDSGVDYLSFVKSLKVENKNYTYWRNYETKISEDDIKQVEKDTGIDFTGVYSSNGVSLKFDRNYNTEAEFTKTDYHIYLSYFPGVVEINTELLNDMGYAILAGTLPDGSKDEIAISEYVFQTFKIGGYKSYSEDGAETEYETIEKYSDMVGKTIYVNNRQYTVTAVIDTGLDLDRYIGLTEEKEYVSNADQIVNYVLLNELAYLQSASFSGMMMGGEGFIDRIKEDVVEIYNVNTWIDVDSESDYGIDFYRFASTDQLDFSTVEWIGEPKTELGEKEVIITTDAVYSEKEEGEIKFTENNNKVNLTYYDEYNYDPQDIGEYTIVGVIDTVAGNSKDNYSAVYVNNQFLEDYTNRVAGDYRYVIGSMPSDKNGIKDAVTYAYTDNDGIRYEIQNEVTYQLDTVNEILQTLSKVFLYVGIGFALFAALMLSNFIATSVAHKKQEIGILRAIGSRSNDVFRIFFSESFIIAAINFVLSTAGVIIATIIINNVIRNELGVLITILSFGIRQILLLFVVSMAVAAAASFIPVKRIASKKPIDAIRDR